MPLIYESGGLLRVGNALAGSEDCCCGKAISPYGVCGAPCLFRVAIDDLDSEMAACGEELPEAWELNSRRGCDNFFLVSRDFPALTAVSKASSDPDLCEEYEGIQDSERYGRRACSDFVGVGDADSTFGFFAVPPVGGYKVWSRSGLSELPDHDSGNFDQVFKYFYYAYSIGLSCSLDRYASSCQVCGGQQVTPKSWYAHAYLQLIISESRSQNGVTTQYYRSSYRTLSGYYDLPFALQTCGQVASPTPRDGLYCQIERPTGCSAVNEYYPEVPVEITVSLDDGVTAAGTTAAWTYSNEYVFDSDGFTVDYPDDMKEPGGITVRLADRCCCSYVDPETDEIVSDYCNEENPLP